MCMSSRRSPDEGRWRQSQIKSPSGQSHRDKAGHPSGTLGAAETFAGQNPLQSACADPDLTSMLSIKGLNAYSISGIAELHERGHTKVKGNAVVAFHLHTDHFFEEAPTRETNATGYLIQVYKGTPQSEPGGESEKKGGYIRTRVRVLVIDHPRTWLPRSLQDRQIL
ncbi:hypothetical protein BDM02DRAFT_1472273 [Thelephora ganbajun]|uniref:Uncharacterized protein n=1 Tax=Thelephora ganbajun TaxID=370292 RepID=A0ACB6ZL97_THEGA|nr:hypothetical protein BDM02DRAFT_1472273 [Thelephora ganbajun]